MRLRCQASGSARGTGLGSTKARYLTATSRATSSPGHGLPLQGQSLGEVSFVLCLDDVRAVIDGELVRRTFLHLQTWLRLLLERPPGAQTHRETSRGAVFCVLEGLSRRQTATQETVRRRKRGGRGGSGRYVHERRTLPRWKAPYDFTNQREQFEQFEPLYITLLKSLGAVEFPTQVLGARRQGTTSVDDTMLDIRDPMYAVAALKGIAMRILAQKRTLFMTPDYMGTGPEEMQSGDHVFLIAGVPTPMILRPTGGQESSFRVVGAALVHGVMHGQAFHAHKQGEVILV